LASIVNYTAATLSDNPLDLTAVQAKDHQRAYAMTVGLISAIVTGMVVVIHIDRYSPLESMLWRKAFGPQSKFETVLVFALILWWFVAAIVQTSVRGIAGDGKTQYNLFYSSWVCCWTTLWIGEGMVVDYGYPTFRTFVTSWPYRAPGWIAIFLVDLFTLWWYINLFNHTKRNAEWLPKQTKPFYEDIPEAQYQLMLFVSAITLVPSAAFIIVEILRGSELGNDESDESLRRSVTAPSLPSPANGLMAVSHETSQEHQQPEKKSVEIILEGICLLCLTVMWILSVVVVTTPGGFANQVGNAYFCTWATTLFVLETFLWFIHDWRKSVFKALQQKEAEYRRHQRQVLETTMLKLHGSTDRRGHPTDSGGENDYDYDDDDDDDYDDDDDDDDDAMSDDDYNDAEQYKEQKDQRARVPTLDIHTGEPDDSAAAQELRLKQANERAYFDTLDDILE
jgi:hypothetical protein